jgi:hypothetical protein
MTAWAKATLVLIGTCTAAACCLTGCDKGPASAGPPPQPQAQAQAPAATSITPTASERVLAANPEAPPQPDPSRTDPEAVAMRQRFFEWRMAKKKVAADAALKQAEEANGQPQQPADKN